MIWQQINLRLERIIITENCGGNSIYNADNSNVLKGRVVELYSRHVEPVGDAGVLPYWNEPIFHWVLHLCDEYSWYETKITLSSQCRQRWIILNTFELVIVETKTAPADLNLVIFIAGER